MRKLHLSFKLSIASLLAMYVAAFIGVQQLLRVSALDSSLNDDVLTQVATRVKFLLWLIPILAMMHVLFLIWGLIHEYRKKH